MDEPDYIQNIKKIISKEWNIAESKLNVLSDTDLNPDRTICISYEDLIFLVDYANEYNSWYIYKLRPVEAMIIRNEYFKEEIFK